MDAKRSRRGTGTVVAVVLAQLIVGATSAVAGSAGADPKANFPFRGLPNSCFSRPRGAKCINAGVYWLDRARARLRQPPYKLPANFVRLSPTRQVFILANLDRIRYRLPPIPGLTLALNRDALGNLPHDPYGVLGGGDPFPTDPNLVQFTSNWAGGFPNIVLAYESWMYDDGYGSPNADCTSPGAAGCWGHRHDVLWKFPNSGGPAAMGAAAGKDKHGQSGFALLLARGDAGYHARYAYTWRKAKADGAGRHNYSVSKPS